MEISKKIEDAIMIVYSQSKNPSVVIMSNNTHDELVKELAIYTFLPVQQLKLQKYMGLRVIPSESLSDEEILVL